jgi:hypothetical protein
VYVAAVCQDLIVRAVDPRKNIGPTVSVLSFQVEKSQPTQLIELMARMRLIKSRKTLGHDIARRALQSMRERVDLGMHGILRKELFQRKPELLENLKELVRVEVGDSSTSYERRKKTLEHEYYAQSLCPARSELMFNQRTEFV